jgi:lipoprotein-anchoring transpeptidase ErfK/SrfK
MNRTAKAMGRLMALMVAIAAAERALAQTTAAPEPQPDAPRRIVISIPAMTLELVENSELVKSYRIAVGKRSTPTPTGTFQIASMVKEPTWYGPRGEIAKPGPKNPVGTRWIGLDRKGYGIHGTNAPGSMGRAASHGCIRLRNADAEDLFQRVRVGDQVEILYQVAPAGGAEYQDVYSRAVAALSSDGAGN